MPTSGVCQWPRSNIPTSVLFMATTGSPATHPREKPTTTALGETIRRIRRERGWSQERLAEAIGGAMQQSDVSALERGRVGLPRRQRIEAIANVLGMPLGELLAASGWSSADAYFVDADQGAPDLSAIRSALDAVVGQLTEEEVESVIRYGQHLARERRRKASRSKRSDRIERAQGAA